MNKKLRGAEYVDEYLIKLGVFNRSILIRSSKQNASNNMDQLNCTLKNTKHSHMPKKSSSFHHHLTNYFKQIQAGIVFLVLPSLISSILYSKLEQSTP